MSLYKGIREMFIREYHKSEDAGLFLKSICNCTVPSNAFLELYKELPPIESNPENLKSLQMYADEVFPDKEQAFKERFMKIVYTIGESI